MPATGEWIEGMGTSAMLEFQRAEQEFVEAEEELLACKSRLDAAKSRVFNNPKAILHLISGILLDKFSLPVGEVGKHLQGATSRKLSLYLKETHGGLKKFIEVLTHTDAIGWLHFTSPLLFSPMLPKPSNLTLLPNPSSSAKKHITPFVQCSIYIPFVSECMRLYHA